MTEVIQGGTNEIQFTEEQQVYVDKLVGKARIKAREKAEVNLKTAQEQEAQKAEQDRLEQDKDWQALVAVHQGRVAELEPYEEEVKKYRELIAGMLKDRMKALGDAAKKAVDALPESLSDLEKLDWLTKSQDLFGGEAAPPVGTPAKKVRTRTQTADEKAKAIEDRIRPHL